MRKSEENNKFRKKENAKKQYGSKSERLEKHICNNHRKRLLNALN